MRVRLARACETTPYGSMRDSMLLILSSIASTLFIIILSASINAYMYVCVCSLGGQCVIGGQCLYMYV